MNKIFIDTKNYNLNIENNLVYEIHIQNDTDITISVLENINSKINLFIKNSQVKITINNLENSDLIVNQLAINSSISLNINLKLHSKIRYNNSILTNIDSINDITINHLESNSEANIFANGINLSDNKFFFIIDGIVNKDSLNVVLDEKSKIINIGEGNSKIIPNLIVNNQDVVANHSAFIGKFNDEEINYLKSRGISDKTAKKLLLISLLLGNMVDISYLEFRNFIDNNIII